MTDHRTEHPRLTRRRIVALGGTAAGALAAGPLIAASSAAEHGRGRHHDHDRHQRHDGGAEPQAGSLPVGDIEEIVGIDGTVSSGVLSLDLARDDLGDVQGPMGVTFNGSFEIDGTLTFQPLAAGRTFFNGDVPLATSETNRFLDAVIANGLIVQAFHQHYDVSDPQIWFVHFRGTGDARTVARAVRACLDATGAKLPQSSPAHPTTPLDEHRLADILGGDAEVGDEGVVTVTVPRTDRIVIDGIEASPEANISTNVQFKPGDGGAAVAPDFSMRADEVMPVLAAMRSAGWHVGCLYNQETGELPQLYFAHMLKTGDPYALAAEVRRGLEHTAV